LISLAFLASLAVQMLDLGSSTLRNAVESVIMEFFRPVTIRLK